MLLAILLISLLVYAWGLFSEYQNAQNELANIEDTAKFNEQFTNYDRKNVLGYEILSLVNQVIDYNTRESKDAQATGNDKYRPITISINLNDGAEAFTKDGTIRLFTANTYIQNNTVNSLASIISKATTIENRYGGSDSATRIAKSIDSIFLTQAQLNYNNNLGMSEEESWSGAIKKFNSYSTNLTVSTKDALLAQKEDTYTYYEYMQFKRAKFDSASSELQYDETTGRVVKMVFNFTGNIY